MRDMKTVREKVGTPALIFEKENYRVKFAETPEELQAVFKLRYRVFHQEQKRAKKTSLGGLDIDSFDDYCLHLMVVRKDNGVVVGTYRIHFGSIAEHSELGFYSEQEYRIDGIKNIASESIEVGRSCIAPDERNGTVVALLWSGISQLIYRSGQRYLIGCVSLEDDTPETGWKLYSWFREGGKLSDEIFSEPLPGFELLGKNEFIRKNFSFEGIQQEIPPLFKGYLRMGAKICGEPAFDAGFGSIDFFIVLDVRKLPERYLRHFNVKNIGMK